MNIQEFQPTGRVDVLDVDGTRVVRIDLSGHAGPEEIQAAVEEGSARIRALPPRSALVLVDVGGVPYTLRFARMLCDAARLNSPHVRARALVGAPGTAESAVRELAVITECPIEMFSDATEAMEWLAYQGRAG